jgi:hypothetical protein
MQSGPAMIANRTGSRLAPLAPGLPILGNGLDLYRDARAAFVRCDHELGPIYRPRGPGRNSTALTGPKATPPRHPPGHRVRIRIMRARL